MVVRSPAKPWWPHVRLRTAGRWRGKAWLYEVTNEAILEFADRYEVYELAQPVFDTMLAETYTERIVRLLNLRPSHVVGKSGTVAGDTRLGETIRLAAG
jgi:hypothetical protein